MDAWEPQRKEDRSEVGHWLVGGHDVAILQCIVRETKYPWREETAYTHWMAQCNTCPGARFIWQRDKTAAQHDLEGHIEATERLTTVFSIVGYHDVEF